MAIFSLKHLYANAVLDSSVNLCVCSFATKITFPLSNFRTKHIFGILMVLRKYEDHLGGRSDPKFTFFSAAAAEAVPDGVPKAP